MKEEEKRADEIVSTLSDNGKRRQRREIGSAERSSGSRTEAGSVKKKFSSEEKQSSDQKMLSLPEKIVINNCSSKKKDTSATPTTPIAANATILAAVRLMTSARKLDSDVDDDIWEDSSAQDEIVDSSDDEKGDAEECNARKGCKNFTPDDLKAKAGKHTKTENGHRSKRKWCRNPPEKQGPDSLTFDCSDNSTHSSDDSEDEREMEKQLWPMFTHPKLGVGPLVPLVLEFPPEVERGPLCGIDSVVEEGKGKVNHKVPAAINRYLQEYQRYGIQFVHSLLVRGIGCILGDDMGLGKTSKAELLTVLFYFLIFNFCLAYLAHVRNSQYTDYIQN